MAKEKRVIDRGAIFFVDPFMVSQINPANPTGVVPVNATLWSALLMSNTPVFNIRGQKRLMGSLSTNQAPAAGFPRLRFNNTGSNTVFDDVIPLVQDTTQANFFYPFDVPVCSGFVTLELTNGAVGAATVYAQMFKFPEGAGPIILGGLTPPAPPPPPPTSYIYVKDAPLTDKGYQQDTTTTSAAAVPLQGVVAAVAAGALYAQVSSEAWSWRWRSDGVAPTATIGNLVPAGATTFIEDAQLANMQVIGTNAAASIINIQYFA